MDHITKEFSGVPALRDISFEIQAGEIHALLGENGAGKSTLMKILSGAYTPTSGSIAINGDTYNHLTTKQSADAGISIIYQELSLVPQLSILENIFVGRLLTTKVFGVSVLDYPAMRARSRELLEMVGLNRSPNTVVRALSISEKQLVEIAKSLAFGARVIVMDEPTSSLVEEEVDRLFTIVGRLRDNGTAVVFISHKLNEVMALADRVTILKDGAAVGTLPIGECTIDLLVQLMVGRELKSKYLSNHADMRGSAEPVLEVSNLTRSDGKVRDISFTLYAGEILGVSGLVGAGRTELMAAIYGAAPKRSGVITLKGRTLKIRRPYDAIKVGIAMVTEDRKGTGFFHNFSVSQNIAIGQDVKSSFWGGLGGLINPRNQQHRAQEQVLDLSIKCRDIHQRIIELSGGNQQKVLLGRQLTAGCEVIIFDEPTKGIDVGTKSAIYTLMRDLADAGVGVLVVSSELPEIMAISDRIMVFSEGRIATVMPVVEATEEKLVRAAALGSAWDKGTQQSEEQP
jgi:D-allose transport system ATP-binding protein